MDKASKRRNKADKLNKRIFEVDLLRGIVVCLMIFDHFIYDLGGVGPAFIKDYPSSVINFAFDYWQWDVRLIFHYAAVFVFLGLTGVCCSFSRSNLRRGAKLFCVALLLTLATFALEKLFGMTDLTIIFGVLHCISVTLMVIGVMQRFVENKWVYLGVGVVLLTVGIVIKTCFFGGAVSYSKNEMSLAQLSFNLIIGLNACGADSFPIFLNGGQIFIGVYLGKQFYRDKKSLFNLKYRENPVNFLGRYSLATYILSQIIAPALIVIVFLCMGYGLKF